jgi:hypothetical protein
VVSKIILFTQNSTNIEDNIMEKQNSKSDLSKKSNKEYKKSQTGLVITMSSVITILLITILILSYFLFRKENKIELTQSTEGISTPTKIPTPILLTPTVVENCPRESFITYSQTIKSKVDDFMNCELAMETMNNMFIPDMLTILEKFKNEFAIIDPPVCMTYYYDQLLNGMNSYIDSYKSLTQHKPDFETVELFDNAKNFFSKANEELERLTICAPYCGVH